MKFREKSGIAQNQEKSGSAWRTETHKTVKGDANKHLHKDMVK